MQNTETAPLDPKAKSSVGSCILLVLVFALAGCVTTQPPRPAQSFSFASDTFAYRNELKWEYGFNSRGKWTAHRRNPPPTYWLRCFVVSRSAKQFFLAARFDPALSRASESEYRRLIRRVVSSSPIQPRAESDKIVIPGYPNLRQFSSENEAILKAECGGAWRSYFQRGHWRMVFPFTRKQQEKAAARLEQELREQGIAVVHVAVFPKLTINHAVVVFDAKPDKREIQFSVYDPNRPESPILMTFDRGKQSFHFPQTNYFPGGSVDAYVVYRSLFY